MKTIPNSTLHHLGQLKPLIEAMMKSEGRIVGEDTLCELCEGIAMPYEIHHTKYEGATYYDLRVVCRSCNRIGENVGLD